MNRIDDTHDPALVCWVPGANGHDQFPVQNLPLAIFTPPGGNGRRAGVAIGDGILDLSAVADLFEGEARDLAAAAGATSLNGLFAAGHGARADLRRSLSRLLTDGSSRGQVEPALHRASACVLHLPFEIGGYTDFYAGIHHAENVGGLLRPDNPLMPNYKFVPIGYHGRTSSIRPSGVGVRRPSGQRKAVGAEAPVFLPTARLDYELEMGIWIGASNALGEPIPIGEANSHIGGLSLLNDWSARDIQTWEYQPLGPFLGKNFHSTVSPWVVTTEALAPFRTAQPPRPAGDPRPLPYLHDAQDQAEGAFAITMEVHLCSARMQDEGLAPMLLSSGSMTNMYWTPAQLVAHHACNGCNLMPGDLLGTGTLSGKTPQSFGSLMEITRGGSAAFTLPTGEARTFLEDGDEVIMTAHAERDGYARIGFGECRGRILA